MEKNITELDSNYKSESIDGFELEFHPGYESPIRLEGVPFTWNDGRHSRLPENVVTRCEVQLNTMAFQGAGELIRFRTDSPYFGITAEFDEVNVGKKRGCSTGFDAYIHAGEDMRFVGNRVLPADQTTLNAVWSGLLPRDGRMYDVTLMFPCLSAVGKLHVGIKPGSRLEAPTPHHRPGRLVFYGSSITNCGHAGRPGLLHTAMIGRMLDIEVVNLGFCGRCKGDLPIADAAASLDPTCFIIEFDHNAPDPGFLNERHEKFYKYFRSLRPDTPVLLLSRADFFTSSDEVFTRRNVIVRTWQNAVASGDRHVDFLDGETLFAGPFRYDCTDDNCHQNDIGEALMAERIADRLRSHLFFR